MKREDVLKVAAELRQRGDAEYVKGMEVSKRDECLGLEYKLGHGKFGALEYSAHRDMATLIARHHAFHEAADALESAAADGGRGEVVAYKWAGCLIPAEESMPIHRAEGKPLYGTPAPPAGVDGSSPEVEAFLSEVRAELIRARAKFPGDRIMTIALAEEFGELCKAILDESAANVRKEAVQTAVMCARVVLDGDGSVSEWRKERGLDQLLEAPK